MFELRGQQHVVIISKKKGSAYNELYSLIKKKRKRKRKGAIFYINKWFYINFRHSH